ncbi:MAG: putative manganese-dependent inorganic diphosphatase [Aminobacterium sp.]|jgi:manganese-dependent inorganic pyrophosphatase|nr:putative manganese-dependent inorganic diphosphatase [Aminobacterium sp.]MDD2206799.1 putative manganese-dependent inorganic diphosphatase [Aminobacterium sp.]MDD3707279.1 putative manganese-dependent inorganic diphosphatase [Aminobacterium sp.]MDD4228555.1 putative manganese-dependent inorganic diphosphatase [Aminobacterium sp.]MDD4551469.1 putative manganese-dependent inorganic diphosphatase [Aminobacterium sp.]MEA4876636.1 putative manganese-dependent inorganic diphosphatase [Aminobacter
MKTVYILGHVNPDTDSICSAIAYSHYKSAVSKNNRYIPVRLGVPNNETKFVLDYFKEPTPIMLENIYTQLSDIPFDEPVNVKMKTPLSDVWNLMSKSSIKTVNVVDEKNLFLGLVTLGDIAKASLEMGDTFSDVQIPLKNIVKTLNGELLFACNMSFNGRVVVAGMESETLKRHLDRKTLVIVGDRKEIQIQALQSKIHTLVIADGAAVSDEISLLAREKKVNLITVPYDLYSTVKRIARSVPVEYIARTDKVVTFALHEELDDIKDSLLKHKYRHFPILHNKVPVGMLSRRHLLTATGKNVILVDHNEKTQSIEGLEQAQILEIIDHHRIGSIETFQPIVFINRPVGCTATIIYSLYKDSGVELPSSIAGLMCAAILSDTLVFKSPTCSSEDMEAAEELADLANIDIDSFSRSMFEAGTSLRGKTAEEIFFTDYKSFNVADFKIGVSQVFFYNTQRDFDKKSLLDFMQEYKTRGGYDMLLLMLTDIINEGSEFLFVGNREELISRAFDIEIHGESFYLPHVISRKKQVIPQLIESIKRS